MTGRRSGWAEGFILRSCRRAMHRFLNLQKGFDRLRYDTTITEREPMSPDRKARWLRLFLRIYSVASLILFPMLFLGFSLRAPVLDQGGSLNWAIWDDVRDHVGPMLFVIYIVWSVFLFKSAGDLRRYASFLDFTIWANLAHGLLMVVQTTTSHHDFAKIFTDVPWILVLPLVIGSLREAYATPESVEANR
jgi:hypothetical protein